MILDELLPKISEISDFFELTPDNVAIEMVDEYLSIQDLVVIPVTAIDFWISSSDCIEVYSQINSEEILIGELWPLKSVSFAKNQMPNSVFICFLFEASITEYETGEDYLCKSSYLVVNKEHYEYYKNTLMKTSEVWGGFSHESTPPTCTKIVNRIDACSDIAILSGAFKDNSKQEIKSSNCFEKFLKIYHQFELLFDVTLVKKLKKVPDIEIKKFSSLLSKFLNNKSELDRFKLLLKEYIRDSDQLISTLGSLDFQTHNSLMKDIFQDETKDDGNPLKDPERFEDFIQSHSIGKLGESKIFTHGTGHKKLDLPKIPVNTLEKSLEIYAYWIYRIRCCIAHRKIGEFIFDSTHEEFVYDIGIKMIRRLLVILLQSNDLKLLLNELNE